MTLGCLAISMGFRASGLLPGDAHHGVQGLRTPPWIRPSCVLDRMAVPMWRLRHRRLQNPQPQPLAAAPNFSLQPNSSRKFFGLAASRSKTKIRLSRKFRPHLTSSDIADPHVHILPEAGLGLVLVFNVTFSTQNEQTCRRLQISKLQ